MSYLASLTVKDRKYRRDCKYCQCKLLTTRHLHKHMLQSHYQMGGGGLASRPDQKRVTSPIITEGKGDISFHTLSFKASLSTPQEQLDHVTVIVNPYLLTSLDILVYDLEDNLVTIFANLNCSQTILIGGSFGIQYKRPIETGGVEIGYTQMYCIPSYVTDDDEIIVKSCRKNTKIDFR